MTTVNVTESATTVTADSSATVTAAVTATTVEADGGTTVTVEAPSTEVIVVESATSIAVPVQMVEVVTVGIQGPPGTGAVQSVAGEALSALRVVYADPADGRAYYADNGTLSHAASLIGVTTAAVTAGDTVDIQASGYLTDSNWSWDTDGDPALYLGTNGAIVQGAPGGAFVAPVGFVVSPTKIFIRIHQSILH
jgi:hypothetical protein